MKNVKEYVKKKVMYIKNYKVTSNRNISKETKKQNEEKNFFFLSGFSFTTVHKSQDCRGRGRAFL